MPGCTLERKVSGSTAIVRIAGKFEGACAWDLARRLSSEPLHEVVLDFSQTQEFVDYGIAVMANALASMPEKHIHLRGLRQHQERLFRYFGVGDAPADEHGDGFRDESVPPAPMSEVV
jgi:anti-anti-sigma regulatory factor